MKQAKMFSTRINLPSKTREKIITILNQQLADTIDLYSQTKQAHWNVKGAEFYTLHGLFDKLAEEVESAVDSIAERVTTLGGVAHGTIRMASVKSSLSEYPSDVFDSLQVVEILAIRYAHAANSMRTAIDTVTKNGDVCTADLLTEISRELDKSLWFLEAHLQ